jgi:hypothetical protein
MEDSIMAKISELLGGIGSGLNADLVRGVDISSGDNPIIKGALTATGDAPISACRAFVNFKGTDTVTIRESKNVSSVDDNDTGRYTVNFIVAMQDENYCVVTRAKGTANIVEGGKSNSTYDKSSVGIQTYDTANSSATDSEYVNVAIFR